MRTCKAVCARTLGLALTCLAALVVSPALAQTGPSGQGMGSAAGGPVRLGPPAAPAAENAPAVQPQPDPYGTRSQSAAIPSPDLTVPQDDRERSSGAAPPGARQPAQPSLLPPGTLGQVQADYEVHGELVLVSGQLQGFNETCGFGRRPDREELLQWYEHYDLARNMSRIRGIWELGVELGREGPCTVEQHQALVGYWESLLTRTRTYVQNYR
ncbi:hypothetical protein [Indioceanicola profundi]|uniref:hypothetical protein n=1 Tax=Indioceanicola profundi TaxID=2220096 RepID=UPI000E6AC7E6|nr:hypothetical protein [Indioceanicola profundi]